MGKMKQETPPCDGCICRDSEITTELRNENNKIKQDAEQ